MQGSDLKNKNKITKKFPFNPGFPFNERSNDDKGGKEPYERLLGYKCPLAQHTCE